MSEDFTSARATTGERGAATPDRIAERPSQACGPGNLFRTGIAECTDAAMVAATIADCSQVPFRPLRQVSSVPSDGPEIGQETQDPV